MTALTDVDDDDLLSFNGVNAATGSYLFDPIKVDALADAICGRAVGGETNDPVHIADLAARRARKDEAHLGVKEGINPAKLDEAGWGVIFPAVAAGSAEHRQQEAIYDALAPLLRLRRSQAAKVKEHLYKEYRGEKAYRRGDTKQKFLANQGAGHGPADPDVVPYYLLLVGGPEEIPFHIQYQLDVQYAVGRIHFDNVEDYAHYAQSVVLAETGGLDLPRDVAFVGVSNSGDKATHLSRRRLVAPLANWAEALAVPGWTISRYFDEDATKANIAELFGGRKRPALLFSSSHGMGFSKDDPLQQRRQGALLLQDWRGNIGPIGEDMYFSGDDLSSNANLAGLVTFHYACYGAGTPEYDEFTKPGTKREPIANRPFVAGLAKKLLGHAKGGALACIGHIERAWSCSFVAPTGATKTRTSQLAVFESTLGALMKGTPVGAALEYFNQRYAEMASDLNIALADEFGLDLPTARELTDLWISSRDARGYAIIGDPAVSIPQGTSRSQTNAHDHESPSLTGLSPSIVTADNPSNTAMEAPVAPRSSAATTDVAELAANLTESLHALLANKTPLEIRTYAPRNPSEASRPHDPSSAFTRIHFDGSIETIVPMRGEEVDTALWNAHLEMVKQAQAARTGMLGIVLASLGKVDKP